MRRSVILLTTVLALGLAPAPLPKKGPQTVPSLEGEWEVVSWRMQVAHNHSFLYSVAWARITSGRLELWQRDRFEPRWSLALDSSARLGRVDLCEPGSDRVVLGIYKLVGSTLTICYRGLGEERPDAFHNQKQWLLVLKRKSPPK